VGGGAVLFFGYSFVAQHRPLCVRGATVSVSGRAAVNKYTRISDGDLWQ